jgi:NAD(P)-dependent dehydrogenase (short-subunit alcohol dehydrogenase family)
MTQLCEGRVCIVTGAGRGIGREHALMLATNGAKVVVNDTGGSVDGSGGQAGLADEVVNEIEALGGFAVASGDDVSEWMGAKRLVQLAVDTFGGLDVMINNAGILRDRMLVNMTESEWDDVIRVHLKGTFATMHWSAEYWRDRVKSGTNNDARIINTTSVSGIYGNPGQSNYGAAKAGIAALTVIASLELARYGVTVNAISPAALTRMTEDLAIGQASEEERQAMSPMWAAPVATWLASTTSAGITGHVIEASGQVLAIAEGWHRGPVDEPANDPELVGARVLTLLKRARPNADMDGHDRNS